MPFKPSKIFSFKRRMLLLLLISFIMSEMLQVFPPKFSLCYQMGKFLIKHPIIHTFCYNVTVFFNVIQLFQKHISKVALSLYSQSPFFLQKPVSSIIIQYWTLVQRESMIVLYSSKACSASDSSSRVSEEIFICILSSSVFFAGSLLSGAGFACNSSVTRRNTVKTL